MYPSPSLTGGFKHHSTFSKEHDTAQPQHVKLEAVLPLHQSPQPKEQSRLLQMIYRGQVLARKSSIYITILTFLGLFYIFSSAAQSHPPSHPHATIVEEAYVTHLPCTPDPWVLISVQLLLFQTLHDALTSDPTREFVILTCPETPLEKCQELESHGAKLVTQTPWTLDGGRDSGSEEDGADYTPFQALLMDYDRVMYVDPGTILNRPLTDLWKKNEHGEHGLIGFRNPSGEIQLDQGFWMARPSSQLYEYIKLAIETKEPIPWRPIITKSICQATGPRDNDTLAIRAQVWQDPTSFDRQLVEFWRHKLGRMEGYWLARRGVSIMAIPNIEVGMPVYDSVTEVIEEVQTP